MDAAHGADAAAEAGRRAFGKFGGKFAFPVSVAVEAADFAVRAQCRRADVRGVASRYPDSECGGRGKLQPRPHQHFIRGRHSSPSVRIPNVAGKERILKQRRF
nr:hypothetical protein [uncultured Bilophila sp.]